MSEKLGADSVLPGPQDQPLFFPGSDGDVSEHTKQLVDAEVRRIVDECYDEAVAKLRENRGKLDALAKALLERETLDEADAYRVAGVAPDRALAARVAPDEAG